MLKLILSITLLLFISCSDDDSDSVVNVDDSTSTEDSTIVSDSTDSDTISFETDSIAFTNIAITLDEVINVEWSSYPDSNLDYYRVYYASGDSVTMSDSYEIVVKSDTNRELLLTKFGSGLYSFMVVAVVDNGDQIKMIRSNIVSQVIEGESNVTDSLVYTPLEVGAGSFLEISSLLDEVGYEVNITEAGTYELTFSISSSGFNPSIEIYGSDMTEVLLETQGTMAVTFEASDKVYIKFYVKGASFIGDSYVKVNAK